MGTATRADAVPVWHRRRARIYDREAPLGYLLLAPTLVILGLFLLYPFIFGIWLSVTDSELGSLGKFIGISNYSFEFRNTDGVFYGTVVNTFLYTGVTTVFKLGLGLVMALLLNQVFPYRRFVRAALLLPYIIPTVLSYEAWRFMFDPTFSVVNWLLVHGGVISSGYSFLGNATLAMWSLVVVNTWRGMPFYGITLLAGLQTIPPDLYEAAAIDGATTTQRFLHVTLPIIKPVLIIVTMFSVIFTFGDFQLIYALTHGGPANATHVFSTWAFDIGMSAGQLGMGAAVALAMLPALAVLIVGLTIYLRRE